MTTYELRITDTNGHATDRKLTAKSYAKAWEAYAELWDNKAITQIDLLQDGVCIHRTEHKISGTPEAYRVSYTMPKQEG